MWKVFYLKYPPSANRKINKNEKSACRISLGIERKSIIEFVYVVSCLLIVFNCTESSHTIMGSWAANCFRAVRTHLPDALTCDSAQSVPACDMFLGPYQSHQLPQGRPLIVATAALRCLMISAHLSWPWSI